MGEVKFAYCTGCSTLCSKNVDLTFTGEGLAKQVLPLPAFLIGSKYQTCLCSSPGLCQLLLGCMLAASLSSGVECCTLYTRKPPSSNPACCALQLQGFLDAPCRDLRRSYGKLALAWAPCTAWLLSRSNDMPNCAAGVLC